MNINDVLFTLQKLTKSKITQVEIGNALGKTRSDINAKAKRNTELKLSEIQQIEKYFSEKYSLNISLVNNIATTSSPQNACFNQLDLKTQGQRLQHFMDSEKIESLKVLSDILGVSELLTSKVLANVENFDIDIYKKLYDLYNLSPNWLILGIGSIYLHAESLAMAITSSGQVSVDFIEATRKIVREELNQIKKELQQ